ncbi:MAG: HEAT repeat domain-containing protein [Fuerstiella sp.]
MPDDDVIVLSAAVEKLLSPGAPVRQDGDLAADSDVKSVSPSGSLNSTEKIEEFTPDELFSLMESTAPKPSGDVFFNGSPYSQPEAVQESVQHQPRDIPKPSTQNKRAQPETTDVVSNNPVLAHSTVQPTVQPIVQPTVQPTAGMPVNTPAFMPQPMVVHVPVPVPVSQPHAATPHAAPADDAISGQSSTSASHRPEAKTKLPPPPQKSEATEQTTVDANQTAPQTAVLTDTANEINGVTDAQQNANRNDAAAKRLKDLKQFERAIAKASKELLKQKTTSAEKQPKKISKLLAELIAADISSTQQLIPKLTSTGSPAVVGPLECHFAEAPENIRIQIARSLAQVPDPSSSAALLGMMPGSSPEICEAAIRSLVFLKQDECILPLVCAALLNATNRSVLQSAMVEADEADQVAFATHLKTLVHHKDDRLAVVALGLISKLPLETPIKLYAKLVDHKSESIRATAIEAMGQLGEKQAVRFLNTAMKDESTKVRATAASSLAELHSPKSTVLLLHGLHDPEVRVRRSCAKTLTQIEDERIEHGAALALKKETDSTTIEYLLQALGKNGSTEALVTLKKYLESGEEELCRRAFTTLKRLREKKAAKLVLPFLSDDDSDLRRQAAEVLGLCGDPKVLPQLCDTLKTDKVPAVCAAAARALGELHDERAISVLEEALYETHDTKCQAVIALGKLKSTTSVPALLAQLRDPASDVRYHACVALGQMGQISNPELICELLDDKDPMVQRGAKAALEKLGVSYKSGRIGSKLRKVAANLVPWSLVGGLPLGATTVAALIVAVLGYTGYALMGSGFTGFGGPSLRIADVQHVSVSPDGKLASVSRKFKVFETWNLDSGELIQRMELKSVPTGIQFTDTAKILVFAAGGAASLETNTTATADSATDTPLKSLSTHRVAMTPDGTMAAFVGFAGDTQIVDLKSRKTVGKRFKIKNFEKESSVAITNDGSLLLIGGTDGRIEVFSPQNGATVGSVSLAKVLQVDSVSLSSLALDSTSAYLATGTAQGKVLVFNLNDGMKLMGIPHEGKKEIVQLSFMGDQVVYANSAGRFGVCDAKFASSRALKVSVGGRPERVSFSLDGQVAVVQFNEKKKFAAVNLSQDKLLLDMNKTAE